MIEHEQEMLTYTLLWAWQLGPAVFHFATEESHAQRQVVTRRTIQP
jgi:hypothetical protein